MANHQEPQRFWQPHPRHWNRKPRQKVGDPEELNLRGLAKQESMPTSKHTERLSVSTSISSFRENLQYRDPACSPVDREQQLSRKA